MTPHIDRGSGYCVGVSGSKLIWLAEVEPACDWLAARGTPAALELAGALREAGEARWEGQSRQGKPAAAFRFWPAPAVVGLLNQALDASRQRAAA